MRNIKNLRKGFIPQLRTKNPTAKPLKLLLQRSSQRVVVRIGSTTAFNDNLNRIEINTVQAVQNSRSKLLMKQKFTEAGVKTADWYEKAEGLSALINIHEDLINYEDLPYPIVAKSHFGQGGAGNTKLDNQAALEDWMRGKDLRNYIFEKFYNYSREYRLHVTQRENFLSWRKMRKRDARDRWYFNSNNCVWIGEDNPLFDKPVLDKTTKMTIVMLREILKKSY